MNVVRKLITTSAAVFFSQTPTELFSILLPKLRTYFHVGHYKAQLGFVPYHLIPQPGLKPASLRELHLFQGPRRVRWQLQLN